MTFRYRKCLSISEAFRLCTRKSFVCTEHRHIAFMQGFAKTLSICDNLRHVLLSEGKEFCGGNSQGRDSIHLMGCRQRLDYGMRSTKDFTV